MYRAHGVLEGHRLTGMSLAPAHAELRHSVETVETIDPASLPPRVSVLTLPGPSGTQHQVFLLGTAHISEVRRL